MRRNAARKKGFRCQNVSPAVGTCRLLAGDGLDQAIEGDGDQNDGSARPQRRPDLEGAQPPAATSVPRPPAPIIEEMITMFMVELTLLIDAEHQR